MDWVGAHLNIILLVIVGLISLWFVFLETKARSGVPLGKRIALVLVGMGISAALAMLLLHILDL